MGARLPARRSSLVVRTVDEETVVFDPASEQVHTLSPLAAAVFERCDGRHSVAETARRLRVPAQTVEIALTELDAVGLLLTRPSRRVVLRGGLAGGVLAAPFITSVVAPGAAAARSTHGPVTP